jgi:hypothetical protein
MAYIEEIIPDEPIQVPPAHLLFTVPENWNPPTCFPGETTQLATKNHHGSQRGEAQLVDFPPCYIIEEILADLEAEPTTGAERSLQQKSWEETSQSRMRQLVWKASR